MACLHHLDSGIDTVGHARGPIGNSQGVPAKGTKSHLHEDRREGDVEVIRDGIVTNGEIDGGLGFVVAGFKFEGAASGAPERALRGGRVEATAGTLVL